MDAEFMKRAAKKSFKAFKNPYSSVEKVFPEALDKIVGTNFSYIGVKNRPEIPSDLIQQLEETKMFALHTLDAASLGGRAIDTRLTNPISGRPMTGSSSGTAINILLGINDVGIGTDGGGSVLAPAISVNLFSFISPSIYKEFMQQFKKKSTDGHTFSPSIGFITRTFQELTTILSLFFNLDAHNSACSHSILSLNNLSQENLGKIAVENKLHYKNIDTNAERNDLITFVKESISKYDFILSKEGPVDFEGLGDTIIGHMGELTKEYQKNGNKGLVRVVNMANAAAITIPTKDFATAYVLICEDSPEKIRNLIQLAKRMVIESDELLTRYFTDFNHYYSAGFFYS